jgi:tetratricopeptide (TPR) repeat protein
MRNYSYLHFSIPILAIIIFSCSVNRQKVIAESDSRKGFSFYYEALEDVEQGYFTHALSDLDSAIYYHPGYSNFYFAKGQIFDILQKPDSSIKAYEQSVKLKSYNPDAWIRLAELYRQESRYGDAATNYKRAVQQFPDSARFYLRLGECYFRQKKYLLALDGLRDYQQLANPPSIEKKKWQGMTYYGLNENQKAADLLQSYLDQYPNDNEALKYLGLSKFRLGEYDQSISALNKATNINGVDPEIYLFRARYFMIYNKKKDALEQLEVGLKYDSLNADILFELGKFHYQESRLKTGEHYIRRAVKIKPDYWIAYKYLGLIAEANNDLEEALRDYKLFLQNTFVDDPELRQRIEKIQKELPEK